MHNAPIATVYFINRAANSDLTFLEFSCLKIENKAPWGQWISYII